MQYEAWGLHPGNLLESFDSESQALEEVRGLHDAGWAASDLSLGRIEGSSGARVAEGDALAVLSTRGRHTQYAGFEVVCIAQLRRRA